jgi:hypothetical protein
LGNAVSGIWVVGAANNLIGGTNAGARNVISANQGGDGRGGVYFSNPGTTGNYLQGNYIGTDVTGTVAVGNLADGVDLFSQASSNYIGGAVAGAGNLISGNETDGLYLNGTSFNVIQGNFIGTQADGESPLGNAFHNVELDVNANNNTIGGAAPGAGNHIAFAEKYTGVRVRNGNQDDLISGNSIFQNTALGIDLGAAGMTPNVDCESGTAGEANAGQNYPTLTNVCSGGGTRIGGTMEAGAGKSYTLQFFSSPAGNALGYGEGKVFLGQTNVTVGAMCSANFSTYLPVAVPPGWVVTATATDTNHNTSEFSAWVTVTSVPALQAAPAGPGLLSLSWTNNGATFVLQQTESLTPPILWSTVTNPTVLSGAFWVASPGATNGSVFYRLVAP